MRESRRLTSDRTTWIYRFIGLVVVLICAILALSLYARKSISSEMTKMQQQYLAKYALGISESILDPIDAAADQLYTMMRIVNQDDSDRIQSELYSIVDSSSGEVNDIVLYQHADQPGTMMEITPFNSRSVLQSETKWNEYFENRYLSQILSGFIAYQITILDAYRDAMALSTYLPVMIRFNDTDGKSVNYGIITFNLTTILNNLGENFELNISTQETQSVVSVYDQQYRLLETSENLDKYNVPVLSYTPELERFTAYDKELGLFSHKEDDCLTMLAYSHEFGLYFSVRVPSTIIVTSSRNVALYVILIGFFCVLVLVFAVPFIIHVFRDRQLHEQMEVESRFEALQAKMNPHFLFNTLDSLVYTIEDDDKKQALNCVKSLSYILHSDLREERKEIPLTNEIRYIRNYVNLQGIRYKDRFTFDFEIELTDVDIDNLMILKHTIQPLVENSFKHGVFQGARQTQITVAFENTAKALVVTVSDNGNGIDEESRRQLDRLLQAQKTGTRGKHIGLTNINQRIKMLYGQQFGLSLPPCETGFTVKMLLPLLENTHAIV
jgi:two-component system sensor histidine kinase YesM